MKGSGGIESVGPAVSTSPTALANFSVIGTPSEIAAQLRAYVALGVDYFITSFFDPDPAEPLRVLMREVAPLLGVGDKTPPASTPRRESR